MARQKLRKKWWRWGLVGVFVALMGCVLGCRSVRYYAQAVRGQVELWKRQEKIAEVVAQEDTPERLKRKLETILRLREFAESDLDLKVGNHYLTYIQLDHPYVVWNVYAAPEFSIQGKEWWYPVIGKQSYQGYFKKESAMRYANELEKAGYDVYVGGVVAYSTLGWFSDPVLSSFVYEDDPELAGTLFHELTHQKFYVGGDTEFNEAYAVVVEEEGVRRWFEDAGNQTAFETYLKSREREQQLFSLILEVRDELKALYQQFEQEDREGIGRSMAEKRMAKSEKIKSLRERYEALKEQWGGESRYDAWINLSLNNAQLNTIALYHRWEHALRQILNDLEGDVARFHEEIRHLGEMPREDRERRLAALESEGAAIPLAAD